MPITPAQATLIGAGLEVGGGILSNFMSQDASEDLFRMQRQAFQNRYSWTAKDLERAGLNRVLALGSPSGGPTGSMPNIRNPAAGLGSSAKQAALADAQVEALEESAAKDSSQTDLNKEQSTTLVKQGNNYDAQTVAALELARDHRESANAKALQNDITARRNAWLTKPDNEIALTSFFLPGGFSDRLKMQALKQLEKAYKGEGGNALRDILKGVWSSGD